MKEMLLSIFENSKERIKNPFVITFIIAWFAFNWRILFVLFYSQTPVLNRISHIDNNLLSFTNQLLAPLFVAIFYIIGLPYIMCFFDKVSNSATIYRKQNIFNIKIKEIESKQELIIKEIELEDIRANYKEKADLNKKIEEYENILEANETKIKELKSEKETIEDEIKSIAYSDKIYNNYSDDELNSYIKKFYDFLDSDISPYLEDIVLAVSGNDYYSFNIDRYIVDKYIAHEIIQLRSDLPKDFKINDLNEASYYQLSRVGDFFWKEFNRNEPLYKWAMKK